MKDLLVKIFYTLEKEQSDHTHKLTTVQGKLLRLCLPSSFNQTIFQNLRILSATEELRTPDGNHTVNDVGKSDWFLNKCSLSE